MPPQTVSATLPELRVEIQAQQQWITARTQDLSARGFTIAGTDRVVVDGRSAADGLFSGEVEADRRPSGRTAILAVKGDSIAWTTIEVPPAMAKATTAAYLLPLILGPMTAKNRDWLPWHRRVAYLVLLLTVLTAITGTWMLFASERLPV